MCDTVLTRLIRNSFLLIFWNQFIIIIFYNKTVEQTDTAADKLLWEIWKRQIYLQISITPCLTHCIWLFWPCLQQAQLCQWPTESCLRLSVRHWQLLSMSTVLDAWSRDGVNWRDWQKFGTGPHASVCAVTGILLARVAMWHLQLRLISFYLLHPGRHNRQGLEMIHRPALVLTTSFTPTSSSSISALSQQWFCNFHVCVLC